MSFEDKAIDADVSNHYGPRSTGGGKGVIRTAGHKSEFTVDMSSEAPLHDKVVVQPGSLFVDAFSFNGGQQAGVFIGADAISTLVAGDAVSGDVTYTGTAGRVVFTVAHYDIEGARA